VTCAVPIGVPAFRSIETHDGSFVIKITVPHHTRPIIVLIRPPTRMEIPQIMPELMNQCRWLRRPIIREDRFPSTNVRVGEKVVNIRAKDVHDVVVGVEVEVG